MRAACAARDEAEQLWRKAKDPTPAPVRLARAQAKLDRAICLQAESRAALIEHERAFKERRAVLQEKMDENTARVRARRQQLEDIHDELAAEGRAGRHRAEQCAAVRQVHGALCNEVAPTIATLVEQLDSATPAWSILNGLLATLTSSKALLERAIPTKTAQSFDIGDSGGSAGDQGTRQEEGEGSEWSESHELMADVGGAAGDGAADDDDGDDRDMCTDDWWGEPHQRWQAASRWSSCGYGKWERSSWADSWEQEQGRAADEEGAPPAARRRLDDQPQTTTPAATSTTTDADQRDRQHRDRINLVIHRAIDAGIQPITTTGEDLHVLDSAGLDAWVAEHFPGLNQG